MQFKPGDKVRYSDEHISDCDNCDIHWFKFAIGTVLRFNPENKCYLVQWNNRVKPVFMAKGNIAKV